MTKTDHTPSDQIDNKNQTSLSININEDTIKALNIIGQVDLTPQTLASGARIEILMCSIFIVIGLFVLSLAIYLALLAMKPSNEDIILFAFPALVCTLIGTTFVLISIANIKRSRRILKAVS